ncbi:MAG: hypothetical protein EAZ15_09400 [Sphingobacteriales bacterium]|nr:MAG: hypothetical protein EAZ15_09400 [Sphingobacteriales bacterium]
MLNKFLMAQFEAWLQRWYFYPVSATRCDLLGWCFMLISTKNLLASHSKQQLGRPQSHTCLVDFRIL